MGIRVFQQVPSPMNISSTGINAADKHMSVVEMDQLLFVQGDGGPVVVTNDPGIEAHERVGARLKIIGMNGTNTLQLLDKRDEPGGLWLNGDATLGLNQSIELFWCGDRWIEDGRNF